ncbi:VapC toxin family PIN domain ribonuclease [Ensifer sp. NM-2]|uniref:type II toxin-antitoxin system VapC family toxin n=1 Tax=Ensifer sp. NM-2 TaxID=2109730 RepID=UPI000D13CB7D|nr:type II toxin-antitoxin system VapC family toxin [Ensifer sp. NM-2]PSS61943.1 VapC toxin family PIN domain ribonuclease [Ensifer sp. NM-2]
MMVDTSAIVAIAFNEPDAETYDQKVVDAPRRFISAATILELSIVIEARLGEAGAAELDLWLYKAGVEVVAVDAEQITIAGRAWRNFGKGRHPASLDFGDCFSYALAKSRNEPLLFNGDDFSGTDIEAA